MNIHFSVRVRCACGRRACVVARVRKRRGRRRRRFEPSPAWSFVTRRRAPPVLDSRRFIWRQQQRRGSVCWNEAVKLLADSTPHSAQVTSACCHRTDLSRYPAARDCKSSSCDTLLVTIRTLLSLPYHMCVSSWPSRVIGCRVYSDCLIVWWDVDRQPLVVSQLSVRSSATSRLSSERSMQSEARRRGTQQQRARANLYSLCCGGQPGLTNHAADSS